VRANRTCPELVEGKQSLRLQVANFAYRGIEKSVTSALPTCQRYTLAPNQGIDTVYFTDPMSLIFNTFQPMVGVFTAPSSPSLWSVFSPHHHISYIYSISSLWSVFSPHHLHPAYGRCFHRTIIFHIFIPCNKVLNSSPQHA
jgi:hypothetical protein